MKRIAIVTLSLLGLIVSGYMLIGQVAFAQKIIVETVQGHISPLMATITYPDGEKRTVMVVGIGYGSNSYKTHQLQGIGKANAEVTLWLDNIAVIRDTTDVSAIFVLKDGTERELDYYVNGSSVYHFLYIANQDDSTEVIDLQRLQSVEFLTPARKDQEDNAMFAHWEYSPYTGEKLPEE
jgi:hypothetical protein